MADYSLSAGAGDAHLSAVDGLIALPFPEQELRPGKEGRSGGPGYHLAVLRESRDFWDDRSEQVVEAAEQELEADLVALSKSLTSRWGRPETVELWPYLGFDDPDPQYSAPEPLALLSNVAGSMQVWRLPDSARWLALAIGQADPEFPLQLLAAVGVASTLEP
ncbi:hypothetical protein [Streptomyces sp. NBC_00503]|uniref:hypothetical protein n=1 Tax=Streptomyces sp. NBC_00503 TaxID=2903659 RepID=UPI002E8249F8|nr:hypothetical protein [Streptomyces sp. NBC_00503]WUD81290.1 hypothetical protein OG490_12455 [Streptomyces sp. NBC_00503]